MTSRFSAFDFSACFVKLNEPVMTTPSSMTMILLCAMACFGVDLRGNALVDQEIGLAVVRRLLIAVENHLDFDASFMSRHQGLRRSASR